MDYLINQPHRWLYLLIALFLPMAIVYLVTPFVSYLYRKLGVLDDPDSHQHSKVTHQIPVPRGGGVALMAGVLFGLVVLIPFTPQSIAILAGGIVLTMLGVADDIWDISPWWRLLVTIGVGLLVAGVGVGIAFFTNPLTGNIIHLDYPQLVFSFLGQTRHIWILADLFAVIFIVAYMNIINWSTGLDGQMPGFVTMTAIFLAILSTRFLDDPTQITVTVFCLIVAGSYAGYLPWNWFPQKSMPGYGGTSLAGFFLAIASILSGAKVATTIMILAIPTADAVFTIMRRLRAGKSPFKGDRGHLHHKMIDVLGWSKPTVARFYLSSSLLLGILSLYLNHWQKLVTMLIVAAGVFGFLIWAKYQQLSTHGQHP